MGAPAELHGDAIQRVLAAAHLDDAHQISVLVPKKLGDGGIPLHLRIGAFRAIHRQSGVNPAVYLLFNLPQLVRRDGSAVEIKAQAVFRDEGPLLGRVRAHLLVQGAVQEVGGGIVGLHPAAAFRVNAQMHAVPGLHVQPFLVLHHMGARSADLLDGRHVVAVPADLDQSGIGHLAAHLRVKRRLVRNNKQGVPLAAHFQHGSGALVHIVAREIRYGVRLQIQGAHHFALPRRAGPVALFLHQTVEAFHVDVQPAFLRKQGGQVHRESVGIVKLEGKLAGHLPGGSGFRVKQFQAAVQRFIEAGFFTGQYLLHRISTGNQFREHLAEGGHQRIHQFCQERLGEPQAATIAHGTAQNAAQHVIAAVVARQNSVRNGKTQSTHVVGNHTEGDRLLENVVPGGHQLGAGGGINVRVLPAAQGFQPVKQRAEHIRGVIGRLAGKILEPVRALHDGAGAFEAHARIHMAGRQVAHGTVALRIVLDEHQIPNLNAQIGILVHQPALRIAVRGQIHVQFGAGAAGTGLSHHPEIVLHVAVHNVNLRVQPAGTEQFRPVIPGLLVKLPGIPLALVRRVHRGVQPFRRKPPAFHDQLPGPVNGFLLEIIAEGPVAQHLEKRVVVGIIAHILQVIVLASGADALLGVRGAGGLPRRRPHAQEIGNKLVHAGICEQQAGALGHQRGRRHDRVLFLAEKFQKALADLGGGHHIDWKSKSRRIMPVLPPLVNR